MKYFMIILISLLMFSCGDKKNILTPEDSEVFNCSWLVVNGNRGYGVDMKVTPDGIKVLRVAGINYYKSEKYIQTFRISGEIDVLELNDNDVVIYEVLEEEE